MKYMYGALVLVVFCGSCSYGPPGFQRLVLHHSVSLPELGRVRTLRVWLPEDYEGNTDKFYPVLYMQDGQNLFESSTSYAGEWQVDESLDAFAKNSGQGIIAVGIDNSSQRMYEYSPWTNPSYGGGEGQAYVNDLVNSVIPYIQSRYRVKTSAADRAIGGSSMGGLISVYASLYRPDVFGKVLAMSSSFWFAPQSLVSYVKERATAAKDVKFYLDVGTSEGSSVSAAASYVKDTTDLGDLLGSFSWTSSSLKVVIESGAGHNEAAWRGRLPGALSFLWP